MKKAVVIQARLSSTRLPGKILLPLKGGNVIQHCMRALKQTDVDLHILLTDYYSFKELEPFVKEEGYIAFCGPVENVLKRFALATKYFNLGTIVRGNGDNPLASSEIINMALEEYKKTKADYFRFNKEPLGSGAEIINGNFILFADDVAEDDYDKEHVGRKMVESNKFSLIKYIQKDIPEKWQGPNIRISIDTQEDYEKMKKIFDDLYNEEPIKIQDVIRWHDENYKNNKT